MVSAASSSHHIDIPVFFGFCAMTTRSGTADQFYQIINLLDEIMNSLVFWPSQ
jgi:hypothetical protein